MSISTAVPPATSNLAQLLKTAFDGHDLSPLRRQLAALAEAGGAAEATLMDLGLVEQILGDRESGLRRQAQALARQRIYRSSWPASPAALRVLAFMTPGEVNANTPIEFLLQGSDTVLYSLYVTPGLPLPDPLPRHDVAIVIVGESDEARTVLREIERLTAAWPCPLLNRAERVPRLGREELYGLLAAVPGLRMPPTRRIGRDRLESLGRGTAAPGEFFAEGAWPLIVRTIGSHAGRGLARLEDREAARAYLDGHGETEFFLSPYVDYRSPDGLFRKYRIVWVDGRPYPCHMAIADEWKVWYLNAGMTANPRRRAEEEAFLTAFDDGFARRHRAALSGAGERVGLDYWGVDCAEAADGSLLVFEGDIALVAHDMDPPGIFPYKGPAMRKLFAAFQEMLRRRSGVLRTTRPSAPPY